MATYYVSTAGLSGNSGTSMGSSWPASVLNSKTFLPGDTILFNRGDSFTVNLNLANSGSSGNPITYDCYGAGTNIPVLDGNNNNSPVMNVTGAYIAINRLEVRNNKAYPYGAILVNSTHDVTVYWCYVHNANRGIYFLNCTGNTKGLNNWITDVADNTSHTNGGGGAIQYNTCNGAGQEYAYNNIWVQGFGVSPPVGAGDQMSPYKCNGTPSSYILIHDNNVRGTSGDTTTGWGGIMGGDSGGSYQHIYNNTLCNNSIGLDNSGTNIIVENNRVYGAYYNNPHYDAGIVIFGSGATSYTVQNNKLNFTRYDNTVVNKAASSGLTLPTGWSTNTPDHTPDPTITDAMLASDLGFSTLPWNATSPGTVAPIIAYSPTSNVYTKGTAISTWTPSNSGDPATSWSISPSLPTGLSFNTSTGVITGNPSIISGNTLYTITATNAGGSGTNTIHITVNDILPVISYSPSSNTYIAGTAISTWTPSNSGGAATGWSITTGLPAGLSFNSSTGAITGTPTTPHASLTYTVTATNSGGSATTTITIVINAPAISVVVFRQVNLI